MSRRTAASVGVVAWLASMIWAATWPEADGRTFAVWAAVSAAVVTAAVVGSRVLSRALRRAVLKDER